MPYARIHAPRNPAARRAPEGSPVPDLSRRAVTALRTVTAGSAELHAAEPRPVLLRAVEPDEASRATTPVPARLGPVGLRPATPADEPLLRRLFLDARRGYRHAAPPADLDPQLALRYRAHSADRRDRYPDAETAIVLEDGEPVGTITLHHEGGRSHIVDLAVVAERRRRGIASAVLTGLLASDRRLTVTVWERNHGAQRLYERHGFAVVAEQFGYLLMATEADR